MAHELNVTLNYILNAVRTADYRITNFKGQLFRNKFLREELSAMLLIPRDLMDLHYIQGD
jgi:hypothetical protein